MSLSWLDRWVARLWEDGFDWTLAEDQMSSAGKNTLIHVWSTWNLYQHVLSNPWRRPFILIWPDCVYCSDHCNAFPIPHLSSERLFMHVFLMYAVWMYGVYAEVESISWQTLKTNLLKSTGVKNVGISGKFWHLKVFTCLPEGLFSREITVIFPPLLIWKVVLCLSWLNSFMSGCLTDCWFECTGVSAKLFLPPHWVCYCRMPLFLTVQTLLMALMGPKGPIVPLNQLERYLLLQYSHVC